MATRRAWLVLGTTCVGAAGLIYFVHSQQELDRDVRDGVRPARFQQAPRPSRSLACTHGRVPARVQRMAKRVRYEMLQEVMQSASATAPSPEGSKVDPNCEICKLSKSRIVSAEERAAEEAAVSGRPS
jgi:hypothetical protein